MTSSSTGANLSEYLKTKGTFGHWKRAWFVLLTEEKKLLRFKSHKDHTQQQQPRDSISLNPSASGSSVSVQVIDGRGLTGKHNTIAILRSDSSPLVLLADSQQDAAKWLQTLQYMVSSSASESQKSQNEQENATVQLLEGCLDASVVSDEEGRVLGFNSAAERLFGWTKSEMIGQNVRVLMPDSYARHHDKYLLRYKQGGDKRLLGCPRALVAKHKSGAAVPIVLSLGEVENKNVKYYVAVFRDAASTDEDTSRSDAMTSATSSNSLADMDHPSPITPGTCISSRKSAGDLTQIGKKTSFSSKVGTCPFGYGGVEIDTGSSDSSIADDYPATSSGKSSQSNAPICSMGSSDALMSYGRIKLMGEMEDMFSRMRDVMSSELQSMAQYTARQQRTIDTLQIENQRLAEECEKHLQRIQRLEELVAEMQPQSKRFSTLQLLQNEATFPFFMQFCQTKHCAEMCLFYRDVQQYKKKWRESSVSPNCEDMRRDARSIFERYLTSTAPQEINIAGALRTTVNELISNAKSSVGTLVSVFDIACDEVVQQLHQNAYEPFISTGIGRAAMATLQAQKSNNLVLK